MKTPKYPCGELVYVDFTGTIQITRPDYKGGWLYDIERPDGTIIRGVPEDGATNVPKEESITQG